MKEGHYFVPGIDLLLLYWTLTLAVNLSPDRVPVIITGGQMSDGGNIWPRITSAHTLSDVFFMPGALQYATATTAAAAAAEIDAAISSSQGRTVYVRLMTDRRTGDRFW